MNSTVSLIAGGVLLFGTVALANIYLPVLPPVTRAETLAQQTLSYKTTAYKPISTIARKSFIAADPIALPAQSLIEASSIKTRDTSLTQDESTPNSSPNVFAQKRPEPQARRKPHFVSRHPYKPVHAVARVQRARPMVFSHRADPTSLRKARTPVPHYQTHIPQGKYTLSATLGRYAWIRIGNRKTVRVTSGAIVSGLGKVTSVSANTVHFAGGKVLRSKP